MKIINFKRITGFLGLVTIASSPTIVTMDYFIGTKQLGNKYIQTVAKAINAAKYELVVDANTIVSNLKKEIDASFMKEKLAVSVHKIFNDQLFTVNKIIKENGTELTPADLSKETIFNAKINYNYGHKQNQVTNLTIEVSTARINLSSIFSNFQFVDSKGVSDFVDVNDLAIIGKQVLTWVSSSARDLDEVGLTLKNPTSNSIIVKAKSNSKIYGGQVVLKWNLKLFEFYGVKEISTNNPWLKEGLKGYFYLDQNDNKIKIFNFQGYAGSNLSPINPNFIEYYKFIFTNIIDSSKVKEFSFNGNKTAGENGQIFGDFDFDQGMKVTFSSPEFDKIKIFDKNSESWNGFIKSTEFSVNALGEVKQIN